MTWFASVFWSVLFLCMAYLAVHIQLQNQIPRVQQMKLHMARVDSAEGVAEKTQRANERAKKEYLGPQWVRWVVHPVVQMVEQIDRALRRAQQVLWELLAPKLYSLIG